MKVEAGRCHVSMCFYQLQPQRSIGTETLKTRKYEGYDSRTHHRTKILEICVQTIDLFLDAYQGFLLWLYSSSMNHDRTLAANSFCGLNLLIWPWVDDVGAVPKSQVDDTENIIRFTMLGQTDLFCWAWGVFITKRVWGKVILLTSQKTNSLVQSCFTCFNFIEAFAEHLAEDYPLQSH